MHAAPDPPPTAPSRPADRRACFASAPRRRSRQETPGRSLTQAATATRQGRRHLAWSSAQDLTDVRAGPDRRRLQVRRQHARDRPRLQRARPLRLPAGDRRHAAAHGEGDEPGRRQGRARRPQAGRPRVLQHPALRLLARRHLSRRQPLHPRAAPAAARSRSRPSTRASGRSGSTARGGSPARCPRSCRRWSARRLTPRRSPSRPTPRPPTPGHRRPHQRPAAVLRRVTRARRLPAPRPAPCRRCACAQSSALAPFWLRRFGSAPRASSSSAVAVAVLAHRHHQRRRAVGRRPRRCGRPRRAGSGRPRRGRRWPRRSSGVQPGRVDLRAARAQRLHHREVAVERRDHQRGVAVGGCAGRPSPARRAARRPSRGSPRAPRPPAPDRRCGRRCRGRCRARAGPSPGRRGRWRRRRRNPRTPAGRDARRRQRRRGERRDAGDEGGQEGAAVSGHGLGASVECRTGERSWRRSRGRSPPPARRAGARSRRRRSGT